MKGHFFVKRIRIGLVGLVVLSLTGLAAGGASAAVSGRGTASSSITLLSVDLGNVQHLKVLTDAGQGTLDAARLGLSGPQAFASLSAVDASGLLNLALPNPAIKASAPGTSNVPAQLTSIPVNFPSSAVSVAGTSTPIGAGLLASGSILPLKIEAHNNGSAVDSAVGTSIPDLSVLQGLSVIKGVNIAGLSTSANASASKGDTGQVTIDSVDVLSLQGLLGGLGLNLADLPLGALTGILDQLGLKVPTGALNLGDLTGGDLTGVLGAATGLVSSLTSLTGVTDCSGLTSATGSLNGLPILGDLLGSGTGILGGLLAPLNLPVSGIGGLLSACNAGNLTSTVTSVSGILTGALSGLKPTASGLLGDLLGTLTGAPLIQLSGVNFSAIATASDTLAHSSAVTNASFGAIKVGGKSLGVIDLNATVDQINALKGNVLGLVNGVTSTLGLGNLIDIGILERTASTKTEGAYNVANAGLDLLRVSINPPANLGGLLSTVTANPLSGLLGNLGGVVPADTGLATNVLGQAFGLTSLLTQPTTIKVGSIGAGADYTSAVAGDTLSQTPGSGAIGGGSGTLPRTGGTNGAWFAALAAISLAGAFGITRSLRRSPVTHSED
jgi:LPXTG-motif cell wall-anchored protein